MKEMNLGRILIENRHKRGITQDELAAHIGVQKELFPNGKRIFSARYFAVAATGVLF